MAKSGQKLPRGKRKLPSLEEWLTEIAKHLLPCEQFWHFYVLQFFIDGVS